MRGKRSVRRILAWQALVLALGLVACELGWRGVLRLRGRPHDAASARTELETLFSAARDFVPRVASSVPENPVGAPAETRVLHPYFAWEHVGGLAQEEEESALPDDPASSGELAILIVGGSVAEMFGVLGSEHLGRALEADPRFAGSSIRFLRHGRGGYKQPQQLNKVAWLFGQGFRPAIVINVDGFNEVALGNDNAERGTSPLYPSIPHWGSLTLGGVVDREALDRAAEGRAAQERMRRIAKNALRLRVERSALLASLASRWLHALRRDVEEAYESYAASLGRLGSERVLKGPPFEPRPWDVLRRSVRMWKESSASLRAMCEARGIVYLHVLQPTLHDAGSKPLTEEERRIGVAVQTWIEGVELGYPALRAAGLELAASGEHFVDATRVFGDVETSLYIDACHFGEEGNRLLAERIARELLAIWPAAK